MDIQSVTKPMRRLLKIKRCGAVIVAAGSASRMGGVDKILAQLNGEPVIVHCVRAFQQCPAIAEIVIVTTQDKVQQIRELCSGFDKLVDVVVGGKSRPESVSNGLDALTKKMRLAAIHDGARPMVTWELIDRTVRAANTYGAAAPGIPVKDTVKIVSGGLVESTPDRSALQAIQTPQVVDIDLLRGALKKAEDDGVQITDDCSAVEYMGMTVKIVQGDERNLKITTPMDLKMAQMLLEDRV